MLSTYHDDTVKKLIVDPVYPWVVVSIFRKRA